jgi:hypothetical protein
MRHGRRSGEHEVFRPAAPAPRLSSPLAAFSPAGVFVLGFFGAEREAPRSFDFAQDEALLQASRLDGVLR